MTTLTGTSTLLRLVLRRDRVRLVLWVVGIVALVVVSARSVEGLYTTPTQLEGYAAIVADNAAMVVQAGPGYGLDDPTVGAVLVNEAYLWTILAVALMSTFMVTRHTRAEEESERLELLRSAPVGRHAPAAAALAGVLLANLLVGAGAVVGLLAVGFLAAGSLAFGAGLVGAGAVFAGVTLVSAQVASSARATTGSALAVLGVAFVLRAVGDVTENGLSWLSPIGWAQAVRPFADERWWVLILPLVAAVGSVVVADALTSRRDLGSGLLPQRPGRAEAGPRLSSAGALAVRLHRNPLLGWCAGMAAIGVFYGVIADQAETLIEDNPEAADFFAAFGEGTLTEAFFATTMLVLGLVASGATVSAVLRLGKEERAGRLDPLLATPTSRMRWMTGHLLVAVVGTCAVIGVAGASVAAGYVAVSGDRVAVPSLWAAAAVMVAPALTLGSVSALLFGVAPRLAIASWGAFAFCFLVGVFAEVLDLPDAVRAVSPFDHVPALPAQAFDATPLVALVGLSLVLAGIGVVGFVRRDVR